MMGRTSRIERLPAVPFVANLSRTGKRGAQASFGELMRNVTGRFRRGEGRFAVSLELAKPCAGGDSEHRETVTDHR